MPSLPLNEAVACLFELDPSLISKMGPLIGAELPEPVKVTRLSVVIPDPKAVDSHRP
jgi:hypothetical protein